MKNIKLWKQEDFQGGEDNATPGHLIPENTAVQLLNLLPGDEQEPLVLRGGFHRWGLGHEYEDDVKTIFRYVGQAQEVDEPTSKYIVDCILVSDLFLSGGNSVHIHAITLPLGDGTQTELVDETDDIDPPGGDSKPPVPNTKMNYSQITGVRFDPKKHNIFNPLTEQWLMDDYWVDDDGEMPSGNNKVAGRNNASYWPNNDYYDESWTVGTWPTRILSQDGAANLGDVWIELADHPPTFMDVGQYLQVGRPVATKNPAAVISGTNYKNPVLYEPTMEFDLNLGAANKYLKLYWNAWVLTGSDIGSPAIKIQYKNTANPTATWEDFIESGKYLYLIPRAELETTDHLHTGYDETSNNATYSFEVEKRIPYALVTVRCMFVPNYYQAGVDRIYSTFEGVSCSSAKTLDDWVEAP